MIDEDKLKELRPRVEEGRVPLCFAMADSDMLVASAASGPKPFFIHALRSTYIPLLVLAGPQDMASINGVSFANPGSDSEAGCILLKFALFSPISAAGGLDTVLSNVWFDIAGVPIKWHIPVGVLYDYFANGEGLKEQQTSAVMKITIHFQNFPKHVSLDPATGTGFGSVMRWPSLTNVQSQYFYSLKESHFIKHGDISLINKLLPAQMSQLWSAIQYGDIRNFRTINSIICPVHDRELFTATNIPIRVFYDPAHPLAQFGLPAESSTIADVISHVESLVSKASLLSSRPDSKRILFCNGVRVDDQSSFPIKSFYKLFYGFDNYLYFTYIPVAGTTTPGGCDDLPTPAAPTESGATVTAEKQAENNP